MYSGWVEEAEESDAQNKKIMESVMKYMMVCKGRVVMDAFLKKYYKIGFEKVGITSFIPIHTNNAICGNIRQTKNNFKTDLLYDIYFLN